MKWAAAVAILAGTLLAPRAGALVPERSLAQYKHTRWTVAEGAPPIIYALAQGADGYLWIGSAAGLYRFDGVRFEHIPLPKPNGNAWRATALLAARDGAIWVGYSGGDIAAYRGGVLHGEFTVPRTNDDAHIFALTQTRDGAIWAMVARANHWLLRRGGDGKWEEIGAERGFPDELPGDMHAARDGSLWVASDKSILVLRPGARSFERVQSGGLTSYAALSEDPSGRIWLSDNRGSRIVSELPAGAARTVFPTPDFPGFVRHAQFDKAGNLWGVNGEGLFRMRAPDAGALPPGSRAAQVERFTAKDGLTANTTLPLIEDREGNIWVGTSLGLDQFRIPNVVTEQRLVMIPNNGFGMLGASDGTVYVGAADAIYRVAPGSAPQLLTGMPAADTLCEAADGGILALTPRRALRIGPGSATTIPAPGVSAILNANGGLNACATDDSGTLWANGREDGLFSFAAGKWRHDRPAPANIWTATMIRGSDGKLIAWLNSGALVRLGADGRPERILLRGKLSDVRFLYQGRRDLLLGGVFGLARVHQGLLQHVDADRFPWLADSYGAVETPEGQTWLITRAGIVGLNTAELERAFSDPRAGLRPIVLSFEDGLPNVRSLTSQRGVVRGGDGRLWFTTIGGVVWVDPARLVRNALPPPVQIGALVAGGVRYRDPARVLLAKGISRVTIEYTGLSLSIPQRVRFRYRLEGVDEDWVDAGPQREAAYTNLGAGTYRFQVVAANNDGVWNRNGATLEFTIPPTFLQSIWFRLLCLLAAGMLVWAAFAFRVRQVKARMRNRFQVRIAERERIARELHDTLLQSVQGLMLFVQSVRRRVPDDSDLREPIDKALRRANAALIEGRERVRELRSDTASHDLPQALRDTVAELIPDDTPRFTLVVDGAPRPLQGLVSEEALRIAEEAVRNAVRHAHASVVEIVLHYGRGHLRLTVRDDGIGIPETVLASGERTGHYGLIGMRERAGQIGARFAMTSRTGVGTEVMLSVPAWAAYRGRRGRLFDLLRIAKPR